MNKQHTDLTFFANGPDQTLLDRFKATPTDTHLFDVLVSVIFAPVVFISFTTASSRSKKPVSLMVWALTMNQTGQLKQN